MTIGFSIFLYLRFHPEINDNEQCENQSSLAYR